MYIQFEKELEKYGLLDSEKKVVIAVSGGVDSIILFYLMQDIPAAKRPLISVAHVNHKLRAESDAEEKFVKELAESHRVNFFSTHWNKSEHPDSGIEEAARNVRYAFFKEVMEQTQATTLMTAHHQDDQVETILMKLTRGSTLEQMTGIEPVQSFHRGFLIRPLLPFSKEQLYQFAKENEIEYMEDQTNFELEHSRNRFRNLIIPLLKGENFRFNEHIEQFATDLMDLISIAKDPIKESFRELVTLQTDKVEFDLQAFNKYSDAMQRALLVEIMNVIYEGQANRYKTNYIAIIQDWLKKALGNSQLHLTDNILINKSYNQISFHKQITTSQSSNTAENKTSFIIEDMSQLIQLSSSESIELQIEETQSAAVQNSDTIDRLVFHPEKVKFPLTIRHRQPGDRMTYKGLNGSKKIKDIFIDEKVPHTERDNAWLVEDAEGTIIWLILYRKMYLLSELETDKLIYVLKYNQH